MTEPPQPPPPPGRPPQGPPPPPPPPGPAGPPAQPPAGPPGGVPPAVPTAPPGYGYPPPRRGLGGGAIAAIVGVGALVVIGAVLFLFLGRGEPETPPSPQPTQATPSPLPTDTPVTPVPPTTGPTDTLADLLPARVSAFRLEGVAADPTAISNLGATDAIVSRYVRGDGVVVLHNLMAFPSGPSADLAKRQLVDSLVRNLGYVAIGVSRREGVNATRLIGPDEMVVWSNREIVAAVEGPVDLTTGFFLVLPY